jgi:hypothetical protein
MTLASKSGRDLLLLLNSSLLLLLNLLLNSSLLLLLLLLQLLETAIHHTWVHNLAWHVWDGVLWHARYRGQVRT